MINLKIITRTKLGFNIITKRQIAGEGGLAGLLGGDSQLTWILYIFIGLAVLLLVIGGGMELMRWMNTRE